jgi:tetratricopeptide (TPR) repeat protein
MAGEPESPPAALLSDATVRAALRAEFQGNPKAALDLYRTASVAHRDNPFILQKLSKQYSDLSEDVTDAAEQRRFRTTALACARRAVELEPRNAVNVLSLAICYGKLGLISDLRTKIEDSRKVRDYALRAVSLDAHYDYAHHVLGRWNREVASIGATRRWLVRLVYGALPDASLAEAIRQFRLAIELAPTTASHRVELGLALEADGQHAAALVAWRQATALPARDAYDVQELRRATQALRQAQP